MLSSLSKLQEWYDHWFAQASLERIGVDSKGNVYWYDGGKNMFMSPASTNPAYKPRYVLWARL